MWAVRLNRKPHPMAFTEALLKQVCTRLHRAGELTHLDGGFALPQLLLLASSDVAEAVVLPDGKPSGAGHVLLRRRASAIGAVAAVFTCEAWVGFVSAPPEGIEYLAPDDLPRAGDLPDRIEGVVTTGVWPAGQATVHLLSLIDRTPDGSRLRPVQQFTARDYGASRWLESLVGAPPGPG